MGEGRREVMGARTSVWRALDGLSEAGFAGLWGDFRDGWGAAKSWVLVGAYDERWTDCLKQDLQDYGGIFGMGGALGSHGCSHERMTSVGLIV